MEAKIQDLKVRVQNMDTATLVPIYHDEPGDGFVSKISKSDGYVGIWNNEQKHLASIQSKKYALLQHQEAFGTVVSGLEALGWDFNYTTACANDRASMTVSFPGIKTPKFGGISLGAKFFNSYDGSAAFHGHGWMMRQICTNGAYGKSTLGGLGFKRRHIAGENTNLEEITVEKISEFFIDLGSKIEVIEEILETASSIEITFKSREELQNTLSALLSAEKHAKGTIEALKGWETRSKPTDEGIIVTKEELWNAVTYYISHTKLSENMVDVLSMKAEDILNPKKEIIPLVIA